MGCYQCANCNYSTDERDDLPLIDDLSARIDSDDIMGAGQCPECGNMVFDTTGRNYRASECFDELVAALKALLDAESLIDDDYYTAIASAETLGHDALTNATI